MLLLLCSNSAAFHLFVNISFDGENRSALNSFHFLSCGHFQLVFFILNWLFLFKALMISLSVEVLFPDVLSVDHRDDLRSVL